MNRAPIISISIMHFVHSFSSSCLFLFNAHYLRVTRHVSFCQIYHHSINRFLRRFCMYILCTYPTYLLMYLCHVSLLCSWHQYLWHHLVMYQSILILSSVCFGLLSDVQFLRRRPTSFGYHTQLTR